MTNETWIKSSYCAGDSCVQWRKSSYSGAGGSECVERGLDPEQPEVIFVRDSKDLGGPVLTFGTDAWRSFISGIKDGEIG